VAHLG